MVSELNRAIVVAGIDPSSPGAGLRTDLATIRGMKVTAHPIKTAWVDQDLHHGLKKITRVMPLALKAALDAALSTWPTAPVKLGMFADAATIEIVADALGGHAGPVIADPVIGPSAGGSWANASWQNAYRRCLLPIVNLLTPNLAEAQALGQLQDASAEQCAAELCELGCAQVLITGGDEQQNFCNDYLCLGDARYWLCAPRLPGTARGTGCAHSSAISAALALGHNLADACVIGKLAAGERIVGIRPRFPSARHLPWADTKPSPQTRPTMPALERPLGIYPIVADPATIACLADNGADAVQLRLSAADPATVTELICQAARLAAKSKLRLFVNDHWREACAVVKKGLSVYGVHLGQDDLRRADLVAIGAAKLRLGVSAHNWHETAVALAANPSYISFGPVYQTFSKQLSHPPLGIKLLKRMCAELAVPCCAIGGITAERVADVASCEVGGIATIDASDTPDKLAELAKAWRATLR